jgi:hypothetical protein
VATGVCGASVCGYGERIQLKRRSTRSFAVEVPASACSNAASRASSLSLIRSMVALLRREGSGSLRKGVKLAMFAPLGVKLAALTPLWMKLAVVKPVKPVVLRPQGTCRTFSGPSTAEAGSGPLALRLAEGAGSWPLAVLELLEEVELGPLAVLELLEGVGFEPLAVIPQLWQVCFTPLTFVLLIDGMPPMASLPMCSSCRDEGSMRANTLQCDGG